MNNDDLTKSEKIANFFKDNLINFIIVLIVVIYIVRGIAKIVKTNATVDEIIADGILTFVVSITIKLLFRKKAIMVGFEKPSVKATCNAYGDSINSIAPNIDKLDEFCDDENKNRLRIEQTTFLLKYGVKYAEFESGKYEVLPSRKGIDSRQYKLLKYKHKGCTKAKKIRIFRYTSKLITNAYDTTESERELLTASTKKYQSKQFLMNALIGAVCGVLFGYYTLGKGEINVENIIWCSLQMALYLAFGMIEYFNTLEYITKTIREKIKRVMAIIDKFKIWVKNKKEEDNGNTKRFSTEVVSESAE